MPKKLFAILLPTIAFLGACSEPEDLTRAKLLISEFHCPSQNSHWGPLMRSDLEKARIFIDQYEKGLHSFNIPIDQVVATQLNNFQIACKASEEVKK